MAKPPGKTTPPKPSAADVSITTATLKPPGSSVGENTPTTVGEKNLDRRVQTKVKDRLTLKRDAELDDQLRFLSQYLRRRDYAAARVAIDLVYRLVDLINELPEGGSREFAAHELRKLGKILITVTLQKKEPPGWRSERAG